MDWKVFDDQTNQFYKIGFDHVPSLDIYWGWDFIYKEIYDWEFSPTKCIYEMWDCVLEKNDLVVDIGASVGLFTKRASGLASKVIAIDGSPEKFSCLVENTKDLQNVFCLNASIVGGNSPNPYLWSLKGNPLKFSLADVFEIYQIDRIDFLKCDIEGGEYDLFKSTSEKILSKIDRIAIETHNDEQNKDFFLPGKIRHSFVWDYGGGTQTMMYFVTPK